MKITAALVMVILLSQTTMFAVEPTAPASSDPRLQRIVDDAAAAAFQEFAARKLATNQLGITLVDVRDPKKLKRGSFRGDVPIYPASVVKLFYLAATHRWLEDGKLTDAEELRRALRDMIADSSNDATHYVVDALTETASGPELPGAEMNAWGEKRNAVNRYFASLGHTNINANQKPWNDGPYGRDRTWVGFKFENRNKLTTDATARLLTEMALGRCVSAARSAQMLKLMERDPFGKATDQDDQAHGFTGQAILAGGKLWSKAGWTSTTRHDAAYIELPDGRKFVLVIFTTGHANERAIIPFVARRVMERL